MSVKKSLINKTVDSIISKGANVKADEKKRDNKIISLRVPASMLQTIDEIVDQRPIMTRTGWILAVLEKEINEHNGKEF